MQLPIFQVDAFTSRVFAGNPAAVCPLDAWLEDELMQSIATENNLSETAFLVPRDGGYRIRWFTPAVEVDLCGHATLAAAFVVKQFLDRDAGVIELESRSGPLGVRCEDERFVLDFPAWPGEPIEAPAKLIEALGASPVEVVDAPYWMAVLESEAQVRALRPEFARLAQLAKAVIVTAPGDEVDFVSRFFAPTYGIDEDPVTGSAHCTLVPYWSRKLGRRELAARQVSARGGELRCVDRGERVDIAGEAALYLRGTIEVG